MYPNSRPILPPCPEDKIFCGDAPFPIPRDPRTGCGCPQGMRPTFAFGSKIPDKQDPNSINNLYENPLEFYSSNKVHNINRINQGERWDNNFNIPRLPPKSNIKTNAPQSSNNVSFANGQSATTVGENIVVSDKIFPLDSSTIEQCTPPPSGCEQPNPACGWYPYEATPGNWEWQLQPCASGCNCDGANTDPGYDPGYANEYALPITGICTFIG